MSWHVVYEKSAVRDLDRLPQEARRMILKWVDSHLIGCEDPRATGKGLTGNLAGLWRYRVGDYRLIARIDNGTVTVCVIRVDRRDKIYT